MFMDNWCSYINLEIWYCETKCLIQGSAVGFFCGITIVSWMFGGSLVYPPPIVKYYKPKARNAAMCPAPPTTPLLNTTAMLSTTTDLLMTSSIDYSTTLAETTAVVSPVTPYRPPIAEFYAVSYTYYTAIGLATTLIVGLIVSLLNGKCI